MLNLLVWLHVLLGQAAYLPISLQLCWRTQRSWHYCLFSFLFSHASKRPTLFFISILFLASQTLWPLRAAGRPQSTVLHPPLTHTQEHHISWRNVAFVSSWEWAVVPHGSTRIRDSGLAVLLSTRLLGGYNSMAHKSRNSKDFQAEEVPLSSCAFVFSFLFLFLPFLFRGSAAEGVRGKSLSRHTCCWFTNYWAPVTKTSLRLRFLLDVAVVSMWISTSLHSSQLCFHWAFTSPCCCCLGHHFLLDLCHVAFNLDISPRTHAPLHTHAGYFHPTVAKGSK